MQNIQYTQEGFEKLTQELDKLTRERPTAVIDLKKARELGDLSENGYYKASRSKLSQIDNRIRELKTLIKHAIIIKNNKTTDKVSITHTVTLKHQNENLTLKIVGDQEANPMEGKISSYSPLGKALMGQKTGSEVKVITPNGIITYKILGIK